MNDKHTVDIREVEREVGELPATVREALLGFAEGESLRRVARQVFGRRKAARAELDAAIARLDALSFDEH